MCDLRNCQLNLVSLIHTTNTQETNVVVVLCPVIIMRNLCAEPTRVGARGCSAPNGTNDKIDGIAFVFRAVLHCLPIIDTGGEKIFCVSLQMGL